MERRMERKFAPSIYKRCTAQFGNRRQWRSQWSGKIVTALKNHSGVKEPQRHRRITVVKFDTLMSSQRATGRSE